jgi:predicted metal-dependent peptidase
MERSQQMSENTVQAPTSAPQANPMDNGFAKKLLEKTEEKPMEPMVALRNEFDNDFVTLYMNDPFLGSVSMGISKVENNKMPTAAIGAVRTRRGAEIVMYLNTEFFRSLTPEHRRGVIKHELYHYIFGHLGSRAIGDTKYAKLFNYATDLAINSIIGAKELPGFCLIPGKRPVSKDGKEDTSPYGDFIEKAPALQATDYYFEELRKIADQQGDNGNEIMIGDGTLDDHDGWQNLPKELEDEIRDKLKESLSSAVKSAEKSQRWGSVPQEIQEMLKKMISNEVDWRSILRNFLGRSRSQDRISTIKRINKKMPFVYPGTKRPTKAKFVAFIDQSGSMSDEDITLLFGELDNLAKDVVIDIYFFDTEIDHKSHMTWSKGGNKPRIRARCGGTDFNAVANFCNSRENRNKWTGVIILTDGYAPTMGAIHGAKVIQVITETGTVASCRQGDLVCQMKKEKKFKKF